MSYLTRTALPESTVSVEPDAVMKLPWKWAHQCTRRAGEMHLGLRQFERLPSGFTRVEVWQFADGKRAALDNAPIAGVRRQVALGSPGPSISSWETPDRTHRSAAPSPVQAVP